MKNKHLYIIAGPNGVGKTTFATEFLPQYVHCRNFVNADLIATGLSPFSPEIASIRAGRLVLEQINTFAGRGIDFGFETTLSGKAYVGLLKDLKKRGYRIHLFFLWVPNAQLSLARIKDRVARGGHNVPSEDVIRRFQRSISNFFGTYQPLLDTWHLFDNSSEKPRLIARKDQGVLTVIDADFFQEVIKRKC